MSVVNRWICNALEHDVSELHLCLDSIIYRRRFDIPSKIFTSTTLVKLSLETYQHIPSLPSNTYLPSLKVLILDSIWFEVDQLSNVFLAACPTLEDLPFIRSVLQKYRQTSYQAKPLTDSQLTILAMILTILA